MDKIKYEFDPQNRLSVANSSLRGMRKVLDGQFKISGRNSLTYHIKSPIPDEIKLPHQIKLKGTWSLNKNHQLCFTLDKSSRQTFGEQLTFQGEIIDVRRNSLLFSVMTRRKEDLLSTYILELAGCWQADEHNRLTFRVDKENGIYDSLVFEGAWQINNNYQITYSYQKEYLTRRAKQIHRLIFQGHWEIRDKARLSYLLDVNSLSGFDFNTSMEVFKEGYIKYELGIGLLGRKQPVKRTITFFGKWGIKKNLGLVFEVKRQGRKIQVIVFGAEVKLSDKDKVSFNLRNSLNQKIGAELELSRDIFSGDGQAFLRLLKSKEEAAILAGIGWRW
ncbi:MAG: hypothetical protein PHY94_02580 [Candidatus Omnitrophica bacterium]|nr:hypothetical protein [Candidatus Omnitrophota bacterium]